MNAEPMGCPTRSAHRPCVTEPFERRAIHRRRLAFIADSFGNPIERAPVLA